MPDYFVPLDTMYRSPYYEHVLGSGLISQFAYDYVDANRKTLREYRTVEDFDAGITEEKIMSDFISYAAKNKITGSAKDIERCRKELANDLKAYVARQLYRDNGFFKIYLQRDKAFQKALDILQGKPTAKK